MADNKLVQNVKTLFNKIVNKNEQQVLDTDLLDKISDNQVDAESSILLAEETLQLSEKEILLKKEFSTQEDTRHPLLIKNNVQDPLKPFFREYFSISSFPENVQIEHIESHLEYLAAGFEKENRPMTREQYIKVFYEHINLKNFMNEDKAPILKKLWEDSKVVYDLLSPLKNLGITYTIDLTGGCVRDFVLNHHHEIKDLDIMISLQLPARYYVGREVEKVFSKESLEAVAWNGHDVDEVMKTKLVQLCVLESAHKEDLDKIYCFHGVEREHVVETFIYHNSEEKRTVNDRLVGVIKLNGKNTHYPMDFLLTDWIKPQFLEDFDFDICKASFSICNAFYKTQFPKDYSHLISRFSSDTNFWADVLNKKITYDTYERSEKQIQYSFGDHLTRIKKKYPDYELNVINPHGVNYEFAQKCLFAHKLDINLSEKKEKSSHRNKI